MDMLHRKVGAGDAVLDEDGGYDLGLARYEVRGVQAEAGPQSIARFPPSRGFG